MSARIENGVIVLFDQTALRGKIMILHNGEIIGFHSTCFQSAPPTRFPMLGDMVTITFFDDKLVIVHSA